MQRVETTGAGSYETVKSLAAVFEMDVAALRAVEASPPVTFTRRARYWSAAISLVLAVSLVFVAREAIAAQVMLEVGLSLDGKELGKNRLIAAEGKDAEIRLEGELRVILLPTVNADGSVALALQVYEFAGNDFVLISKPRMFVADNEMAEVHLTSPRGSVIKIAITPHRI